MAQDPPTCFLDGLRGAQDDRLLQRCSTRGPRKAGDVLPGVATGMKRFRQELETEGVEAVACMDDVSRGPTRIRTNTVRAFEFLRLELNDTAESAALPPKGTAPMMEEFCSWKTLTSASKTKGG